MQDDSEKEDASYCKGSSQGKIILPEAKDPIDYGHIPVISDGAVNLGPEGSFTRPMLC